MKRNRNQLLFQVARAYYEQGQTQEEIARSLGVSRSQVSHYLRQAREAGIVQIRVVDPDRRAPGLEARLRACFPHLREVRVVPTFSQRTDLIRKVVGRAAAELLQEVVAPGHRVCIGAGRTLREMVHALRHKPVANVVLTQAMGSIGHQALDVDFAELAREAAKAFRAQVFIIHAPAILPEGTTAEAIIATPPVAEALQLARTAHIYMVGLGSLESDLIYARAGLIPSAEMEVLQALPIAGDICGRFFDLAGRPIRSPFEDRVVGIELEDLKQAHLAVGVAGGPEKVIPLLGALRGQYITGLVTDEQTAEALLQRAGEAGG
ncbi:MAG: sugar-binding transcriptional regulator [Anaerolineae bacterium]